MADVVVTRDGDSGGGLGAGLILGIIVAVLAIAFAVWYFGLGGAGTSQGGTDIEINNPQVEVQPPAS